MVFPKRARIFLVYLERWYFFPKNMIFFPCAEIERQSFSGNPWKHDALPSSKEKQEIQYIGLKFDFFLNLFSWRYAIMNNLQYFVPFSPLKVHAKNLVKVTRTEEVKDRKRPPTLTKLSFKFRH